MLVILWLQTLSNIPKSLDENEIYIWIRFETLFFISQSQDELWAAFLMKLLYFCLSLNHNRNIPHFLFGKNFIIIIKPTINRFTVKLCKSNSRIIYFKLWMLFSWRKFDRVASNLDESQPPPNPLSDDTLAKNDMKHSWWNTNPNFLSLLYIMVIRFV